MTIKVGINGFGRIGRQSFKAMFEKYPNDIEIVAVNDLFPPSAFSLLLRYDSVYGHFDVDVKTTDKTETSPATMTVNGKTVQFYAEKDPAMIPWGKLGVDVVLESTGFFTDAAGAAKHIAGGAKKVVISAPAKGEDITIVMGVNENMYDPAKHNIISNASCTTNCLAPAAKVVNDTFGIVRGLMTTVHSYTGDQRLVDTPHKDLRRARHAGESIIPTTTGAAKAVALVIPSLKGKFDGFAMRVPTPTVSIVDFVANVEKPCKKDELIAAFDAAAAGPLKGILGVSKEPLVSVDFRGDERSSIIDAELCMVLGDNMVKVVSWYDNEWGYSCRVSDLVDYIGRKGL